MLACGDNNRPAGPPILASPHIYVTTNQGAAVEIDASATDAADRTLTYTAAPPGHGTVTGTGPKFTYTPAAGFIGSDELTITISNGDQVTTVTVTITVAAHDAGPVAAGGMAYVAQNLSGVVTLAATDADTASLSYTIVAGPMHGTLSGTAPDLVYTPDGGYAGPDQLMYEASDGMLTSNVATLTIAVTVCGDGMATPNEECDDGNTTDGDGCGQSCQVERCGDGVLQLARGEECDDGNTTSGDGCTADCLAEAATTTLPVMVSADLVNCTTTPANATHKIAADTADLYGVFRSGTNGYVVVSHDHGATFSPPLALTVQTPGPTPGTVVHVAVAVGVAGTAYAGYMLQSGEVFVKRTTDHGATWGAA
ncbi:MAG TPA: Ig-like domain-containing protein, partial [Kofleriaceae bacterium]